MLTEPVSKPLDELEACRRELIAQSEMLARVIEEELRPALAAAGHPILNIPNTMSPPLTINYTGIGDEDAMTPADASTYVVLEPASYAGDGGVIVYDDNPAPQSAQIVFYAFNFSALAGSSTT